MSSRAVIVAVVIALGVLILALFFGQSSNNQSKQTCVLGFDPVNLTAIEVHNGDARNRIQRTPEGGWAWADPQDRSITWPAIYPGNAQTAIGALSSLESESMRDVDPLTSDTWLLRFETGESAQELRVEKTQLGGLSRAENGNGDRFLVEASLIRPLVEPGLASWRIARAIPGLYDASRIWIDSGGQTLALARVNAQWSIIQPVAARADAASVSLLIDTIAQLGVERFETRAERSNSDLGFDNPATTLRLQRDSRHADSSGNISTETAESTLFVGSPADPQGTLLYAASAPDAKLVLLVASANLAAIPTEAKTLLAKAASAVQPNDVFGINIRTLDAEITAKRSMGEWTGSSAEQAEELLSFLCTMPAEPSIISADDEIIALSRVELTALDSSRLDLISIGYTADAVLVARAGNIIWLYPNTEPPALLAIPPFDEIPARETTRVPTPGSATYSK